MHKTAESVLRSLFSPARFVSSMASDKQAADDHPELPIDPDWVGIEPVRERRSGLEPLEDCDGAWSCQQSMVEHGNNGIRCMDWNRVDGERISTFSAKRKIHTATHTQNRCSRYRTLDP